MDLYNENEHIISSDEYTDDDEDALMNDAVGVKDYNIRSSEQQPQWRIDQKQKELSSLIRRNKFSVIYKNKSIKWLNNKRHRERYKEHIYLNAKNVQIIPTTEVASYQGEQKNMNKSIDNKCNTMLIHDVVCIADDNNDFTTTANKEKEVSENTSLKCSVNYQSEKQIQIADEKKKNTMNEKNIDLRLAIEKINEQPGKSKGPQSPLIKKDKNENMTKNNEERIRVESSQFHKSINDIFTTFDKIATIHVETIANDTIRATDEKLKCLSNEIEALQEILEAKEMEWKRLLHLKMVKENIYSRLMQKKHILLEKEIYTKQENSLKDLKELENFLSDNKKRLSGTDLSALTIHKLIENRANMSAEDLKREKNNTSRLHSLLVSRNMLHGAQNTSCVSNGENLTTKTDEFFNHLEYENLSLNKGRQKNPELTPRVGKRLKSSESNIHCNFNIPVKSGKSSSNNQHFTKVHQSELFPLQNSIEEISTIPIGRVKHISSGHDNDFVHTMNNNYNIGLDRNHIKSHVKGVDEKYLKNNKYPLCQECKCNESRFVCAGCGNQWYCSKKCQISAWDKHSEFCTE